MWEVWETSEYDSCIEKIGLIRSCTSMDQAVGVAIQCQRPGIEVWCTNGRGYWLSHLTDRFGRWIKPRRHNAQAHTHVRAG